MTETPTVTDVRYDREVTLDPPVKLTDPITHETPPLGDYTTVMRFEGTVNGRRAYWVRARQEHAPSWDQMEDLQRTMLMSVVHDGLAQLALCEDQAGG